MALEITIRASTQKAKKEIESFAKKTGSEISKVEKSGKAMGATFAKVGGVLGGVFAVTKLISFASDSVRAAGIQEKAYARLDANLKNVLVSFKGYEEGSVELQSELGRQNKELIAQAQALQKVTTFGDEQIESGQAMLATFALGSKEISQLTTRMLDMAAAQEKASGTGVDLEQVAIGIGKAIATNTLGGLKRMGVVMDEATESMFKQANEADKLQILLKVLDDNYKGVAEAIGKTDAGKLEQIGNIWSDISEKIGDAFLDLTSIVNLQGALQAVNEFLDTEAKPKAKESDVELLDRQADALSKQLRYLKEGVKVGDEFKLTLESISSEAGIDLFSIPDVAKELEEVNRLIKYFENEEGRNKAAQVQNEIALQAEREAAAREHGAEVQRLTNEALQYQKSDLEELQQKYGYSAEYMESMREDAEQLAELERLGVEYSEKNADAIARGESAANALKNDFQSTADLQIELAFARAAEQAKRLKNFSDGVAQGLAEAVIQGESLSNTLSRIIQQMASRALSGLFSFGLSSLLGVNPGIGLGATIGRSILGFAGGTNSAPGGLAVVGERGPELVNLPRGSQVIPNNQVTNMGAVTINISANSVDERFVKYQLLPLMKKAQKQGFSIA